MSDPGRRPFKLSLSVVPPQRHAQQGGFPPEGVLLSEPMSRFRCNEKGCCCSGWDIPFKLEDFLRLHEHLDEGDRAALTRQLKLVLEPPGPGRNIDEGEQVLHALKLAGLGEDKHCRFLSERGGCAVHEKYGLSALPDLCVDFPAFGYRQGEGAVELFFDPVCPEVLERLDESDEPLRLLHQREPFGWATHDLRVQHAATPVRVSIEGTLLAPDQLLSVRAACVEAFADRSRPPWRALAALLYALRELKAAEALPLAWPADVQDPTAFLKFFHRCISSHSAELLLILFHRYQRFVFALDIKPALAQRDAMKAHLNDFWPAFGEWLAPHEEELQPLAARYLAHRFASPFVRQRGELRQAADSIAHLYGTALRYAAGLAATLQRPVDRALFKVALGASEFFYRSLHLPTESLAWFASARQVQ